MEITVDGHAVHVYTGSRALDAALPSVVFVHGAANDHSVWALQSRYFAWHGYNALAVDLPGHGRSAGAPLATIDALADWIGALVAVAARGRAALVGHSMGSLAVLECAARHPACVERIVLLGPAAPMIVSDALLDAARDDTQLAYEMINAWSFSARATLGINPSPGMSMTGGAMRLMQRARPLALHNDLLACHAYAGGLAAAAACGVPALVIRGARDVMAPVKATPPLIDALRDPRVVTLPDAGHALMAEAPDAVLDALVAFLACG
ncbi:MAG TPA: alpha/beta hydrolase [Casimicrobiaceae bacterium]